MKLTAKREKFANCVADGMTQSDAYRAAFPDKKVTQETIWSKASILMANDKVKTRVSELKSALDKKALWSREKSVMALITAYKDGNPAVKVSAVKELNVMHGYNAPLKIDHTSSDGSMTPKIITAIDPIEAAKQYLDIMGKND